VPSLALSVMDCKEHGKGNFGNAGKGALSVRSPIRSRLYQTETAGRQPAWLLNQHINAPRGLIAIAAGFLSAPSISCLLIHPRPSWWLHYLLGFFVEGGCMLVNYSGRVSGPRRLSSLERRFVAASCRNGSGPEGICIFTPALPTIRNHVRDG